MAEHTAHHNRDEDGRDLTIEGYARQGMDWLIALLGVPMTRVVDMGCDYGYCLEYLRQKLHLLYANINGFDSHYSSNPFGLNIMRWDMTDPNLRMLLPWKASLVVMNHSLEHVQNPYAAIAAASSILEDHGFIFIAVPHRQSPWAFWEYHYTMWDEAWLEHFMKVCGFVSVGMVSRELRQSSVEIWGLFRKMG